MNNAIENKWNEVYKMVNDKPFEDLTMSRNAKLALELFLGKEWIENTVDYIIKFKGEAWDLAIKSLRILESEYATDYAYGIYKNSNNPEYRRQAVFVIKDIAHRKSIDWVEEFLNDDDVAGWGIGVLDQLLWCERIEPDEKTEELLNLALTKYNGELKENVEFIRGYLVEREILNK